MNVQDTLTGITNNTAKVQAEASKERMGKSQMDQDAFLQLLMMQMKTQDPLNPMGNAEFISQQAQFTQIAELQKMNQTNNFMQASNLIGKEVSFPDPNDSKKTIKGVVSETIINSKGTTLVINNEKYALSDVTRNADVSLKTPTQTTQPTQSN